MQASINLLRRISSGLAASLALSLLFAASMRAQDTAAQEGPLEKSHDTTATRAFDNDSVIRMTKAGLEEAIILENVRMHPGQYDVTPDSLIALKQAGVSANVIAAMQARNSGFSTRASSLVSARGIVGPANAPPVDEIGVYYKDKDGHWQPLRTEKCAQRSGGALKNILTDGLVQRDQNGRVHGPHSPLGLTTGTQILIYTPSGVEAEEYSFVRFREHSDAREFRATTGGVFHSMSGHERDEVEFDPEKLGPRIYVFTVAKDQEKGEYAIVPPGITVSKVYTFAIKE